LLLINPLEENKEISKFQNKAVFRPLNSGVNRHIPFYFYFLADQLGSSLIEDRGRQK